MIYAITALGGYLLGSIPAGVLLTRRRFGIDVREMGSGNIGATNVTRVFGWYAGVLTFFLDFLKGYLPLVLLQKYYPDRPWLLAVAGTSIVVGHCFSGFLKLRGGKGVSSTMGAFAAVSPQIFFVASLTYVILLSTIKISAVGSLGAMLIALVSLAVFKPPTEISLLVACLAVVVTLRHRSNIRRLIQMWKNRKKAEGKK